MLRMSDLDLSDEKVLIREDLNVPILNGEISSDARIRAILPTLDIALKANCAILIMSHMGRPKNSPEDPPAESNWNNTCGWHPVSCRGVMRNN